MLEILPDHTRGVLLSYDFIKKYLEGRLDMQTFQENLRIFGREIHEKGVDKAYVNAIYRLDNEHEFHRKAAHSVFVRFARKIGLDIATPEDKVRWIKSVNANQFLDIVSIGAGLLSGLFRFQRWRKHSKAASTRVAMMMGEVVDVDPPDNSHREFKEFFHRMRRRISVRTKDRWAVKLYFAIIFSHMFPDGNGRLARNAYFALRANGLLDEQKAITRGIIIFEVAQKANQGAIFQLMVKEGIPIKNLDEADNYRAAKERVNFFKGEYQYLQYLACKRVLQKRGQWNINVENISYGNWPRDMLADFEHEYQNIKIEWFWMCINVADSYHRYFQGMLDKAIAE